MTLTEKINADIKTAMLAKDQAKLEALRAVKSALLLMDTDKDAGSGSREDKELKMLQKEVKKRKEAADIYTTQNREDLAQVELNQAAVIGNYLPKQLSEEEIRVELKKIIAEVGATSAKDMGKVMGAATKQFAGKADGKVVSTLVKELLG
jgi:uncharacterized protein YqeY